MSEPRAPARIPHDRSCRCENRGTHCDRGRVSQDAQREKGPSARAPDLIPSRLRDARLPARSFLLEAMTQGNLANGHFVRRQLLNEMRTKMRHHRSPVQLSTFPGLNRDLDVLPRYRIGHADNFCAKNIRVQKRYTLDFDRKNLETADVQDLLRPSHNLYIVTILLDNVAGVVPPIHERRWGIEVPDHTVRRLDVKHIVDNLGLYSLPADLHPETVPRL